MIKLSEIMNEMGHSDVNLQRIMRRWEVGGPFTKKRIGVAVMGNPNATKERIYDELRNMNYNDIVQVLKDLMMWEEQALNEGRIKTEGFEEFSTKRQSGAEKIAKSAKEKGGFSLLTYEHFQVKLPYYEKAKQGKFDPEQGKREYKRLLERLVEATEDLNISQTAFQRLVGKIEVVGELIIKSKEK